MLIGVFIAVIKPFLCGIYHRAELSNQSVTPVQPVILHPSTQQSTSTVSAYTCDGRSIVVKCTHMKRRYILLITVRELNGW